MEKQFTLGKTERVRSRKLIQELFNAGQRIQTPPFLVYYRIAKETQDSTADILQFGIGAGTRYFKKAVDRNRIKRLTREAFRLQKLPLRNQLMEQGKQMQLFFVYTGKKLPVATEIPEAVAKAISRMMEILKK